MQKALFFFCHWEVVWAFFFLGGWGCFAQGARQASRAATGVYPGIFLTIIKFWGKTNNMEVVISPHLSHPLILGTIWPGFQVKHMLVDGSCSSEAQEKSSTALAGRWC